MINTVLVDKKPQISTTKVKVYYKDVVHLAVRLFTHSFTQYLLSISDVPHTELTARKAEVKKSAMVPALLIITAINQIIRIFKNAQFSPSRAYPTCYGIQ